MRRTSPLPLPLPVLAALVLSSCATTGTTDPKQILARCPGQAEAIANGVWNIGKSRLMDHIALRDAAQLPMPSAATQIALYAHSVHHSESRWSLVASRADDGNWTLDTVSETHFLVLAPPFTPLAPPMHRSIPIAADIGAQFDAILKDPCFYAEPYAMTMDGGAPVPPPIGGIAYTLETTTPTRSHSAIAFGAPPAPLAAQLIELMQSAQ